jgi:hypothetical protein
MNTLDLDNLCRKVDYYDRLPQTYRTFIHSEQSYNWFIKENRSELEKRGAIVKIGRDYFVHLMAFPQAVEEILISKARASFERAKRRRT